MKLINNIPYVPLAFAKNGKLENKAGLEEISKILKDNKISDLLILSHGWNNDKNEAQQLYDHLSLLILEAVKARPGLSNCLFAVIGVFWPSKKFSDQKMDQTGNAASATWNIQDDHARFIHHLKSLKDFFDGNDTPQIFDDAVKASEKLLNDENALEHFYRHMNTILNTIQHERKGEPEDVVASAFTNEEPQYLLETLRDLDTPYGRSVTTTAQGYGGAAGIGNAMGKMLNGARNLLNFVTYYQMKERAGLIGFNGMNKVLAHINNVAPGCKLHLIGHSFGARLLTASMLNRQGNKTGVRVNTLSLLQAAFSHYAFSENYSGHQKGIFRNVLREKIVQGPILVSYTQNDKALATAYAIASRIARQAGSALGDKNDYYGCLGANGAQETPGMMLEMKGENNEHFSFEPGKLYNLQSDSCIKDHSDICHHHVAAAVVSAIQTVQ